MTTIDHKGVDKLIADLQHGDETQRRYAAEDLGFAQSQKAIPYLAQGMKDPSTAVAEGCANALSRIGGSETADQIAPFLGSENPRLRNQAREILHSIGPDAVPTLIRQLQSHDRDVRIFSVDLLTEMANPSSLKGLLEALNDSDINVAASAVEGIGEIGRPEHVVTLKEYLTAPTWLKCAVLRAMGKLGGIDTKDMILPFVTDTDIMVKHAAIQALTYIHSPSILPDLLRLLLTESLKLFGNDIIPSIHETARQMPQNKRQSVLTDDIIPRLESLIEDQATGHFIKIVDIIGWISPLKSITALFHLIPYSDTEGRKAIVNTLLEKKLQDLAPFQKVLGSSSSSFEQKCAALECVCKSEHEDRNHTIKNYLNSPDEVLKRITLDTIPAEYKPIPAKEIIALLGSDNQAIRISAAKAMGRLKSSAFVDALIRHLDAPDEDTREAIDAALIQIGETKDIPSLRPFLDSLSAEERKMAFEFFGTHQPEQLAEKYIAALGDPSPDIRIIAFKVLANLRLVTLEHVQKGMTDPDESVRVQATRTLAVIPKTGVFFSFIQASLESRLSERLKVEIIHVLANIEDQRRVSLLLALLEDESIWVKMETIEVIRQRGDKSFLNILTSLKSSNNSELAIAAAEAIREIE